MQGDAKVWILTAALGFFGCGAQASVDGPQRRPGSSAAVPPDGTPYAITPSRPIGGGGAGGQSSKGGSDGSAGRAGGTSGTFGSAGAFGVGASAGLSGSSAGGSSAASGAAGVSVEPTTNCPSLTRVRLPSGVCVDRVTEFSVATNPSGIATGSDGQIWFDDGSANQIVQLDDQGRVVNGIPCDPGADARELTSGRDEVVLWYTDWHAKTVTSLSKAMQRTPYAVGFAPAGLSLAEGDQLWLAEANKAIYRFDPSELTLTHWAASPNRAISVGPDKNLWFPEGTLIARLTSAGEKQRFSMSDSFADDICTGPDGGLWFTDGSLNQIGRMAADGTLTRTYDLPPNSKPFRIIAGPDGALWFTESGAEKIGRISVDGVITHYPVPTRNSLPYAITVGPDRNIWFTERFAGKIGRLIPDTVQ
jgi:streptogramin lyase